MTKEPKGRIGSAFDDFLKDEGIFEEVQAGALKKVIGQLLSASDERKAGADFDALREFIGRQGGEPPKAGDERASPRA